ncbi:MAG: repressor LexA [Ignavibacteria bacterium RIFOXYB2_FULL_35_12]|nr:MAG: repressor LexA [Ignavibacteria bacterium GWA2_36_19]OGU54428.1 MAG: repressor LexA [Ignavibacteria bacterium GWC2_35_8]OGU61250.1 MAG: repressor LexA [Ignavibacteria bacterium GWF2_35_20]OGU78897.1 MAG: repressor LexA [Ignavibacteria bacterium RIFOXYA2_FULL_35_9]OGU81044.1 MAG: repressor LexA [Ignavibacteria bacterium RBG_16_35_7]OGU84322.1 MAG: repressor LexA [Ignavibacteria bacterium RIFOXYA12_FULL_35_25]OGU92266.1 MAG: repressor LexA [Ignavibacteria bacterium RIFOXYC12_FULL_35_11]
MKNTLTDRQKDILNFIEQFRNENGYPPTLREIGKRFEISSTFGVKRHLDALVKKGYIAVESNASRGISYLRHEFDNTAVKVIASEDIFTKIPIVGRVAAGTPILAIENIEGSLVIDPSFLKKSGEHFALKVRGDSMIDAGIFDGDFVIVSSRKEALNGEIIVAMVGDEVTVKIYENKVNKVSLIPQNKNYSPIRIDSKSDFSILGKVSGVIRLLN